MSEKQRDLYAGGLVIVIGAGTAIIGQTYKLGSLTAMGPGYFPAALGVLLAFLGVLIIVNAFGAEPVAKAAPIGEIHHAFPEKFDWRAWGCIVGSVLVFMLFSEFIGLVAATFCSVFLACWGDKTAKLRDSALLSLGITIFAVLLFSKVLHVQIPLLRDF